MSGYINIFPQPEGSDYRDYSYIVTHGTIIRVTKTGSQSRYVIAPPVGVYTPNVGGENTSRIKIGYYYTSPLTPETSRVNLVVTGLIGDDSTHHPYIYWWDRRNTQPVPSGNASSTFVSSKLVPYTSLDTDPATGRHIFYMETEYTSLDLDYPEGLTIHDTLYDVLSVMNDSIWDAVNTDDPFAPGGFSEPGGGDGNFDTTTDIVPIPNFPSISVLESGFVKLFAPTTQQLQNLANYMWNNPLFGMDNWRSIIANPIDAIISLMALPFKPAITGTAEVAVGNISTGITMNVASTAYVSINCGSITIQKFTGSYLDYAPLTKIKIYLPYIGFRALSTDDVMDTTLSVTYHIDIFTGICIAYVSVNNSVLYTFSGQCGYSIPITSNNYTNLINSLIGIGATAAGVAVLGATGGTATAIKGVAQTGAVTSVINDVMGSKPEVERSGSISGNAGLLDVQFPFVIIEYPRQSIPNNQNMYEGYPSNITVDFSSLKGFTAVDKVFVKETSATQRERDEIERLLKEGVIF